VNKEMMLCPARRQQAKSSYGAICSGGGAMMFALRPFLLLPRAAHTMRAIIITNTEGALNFAKA
jgi:hypothetical protein